MPPPPIQNSMRIDKWLWHARFVRTRAAATRFIQSGKMRVNGIRKNKPSHQIRAGDVLTFALSARVRVIKIISLSTKRESAPLAQQLYKDLSPPHIPAHTPKGGRPTKKARRNMDKYKPKLY